MAYKTVAAKIARAVKALGLSRFDLKFSAGSLPHERMMPCIALYGMEVVSLVNAALAERSHR
ncbi:MAG: hypothetical protein E6Q44_11860 [Flavobacteriales bacterium]|jgi:hypothetical protein|nr:MAG: hypothetical protein E6Q44_11860 [Flavobacteriales bacterium]